jgi:hypothetical protein
VITYSQQKVNKKKNDMFTITNITKTKSLIRLLSTITLFIIPSYIMAQENSAESKVEVQELQHPSKPVQVMVLGTFHFSFGGGNTGNSEIDDMLSTTRQKQIDNLIDKLKPFAPNKIMLELEPSRETEFNEKYRAYLVGEHKLKANERQQLGMKLAAKLKHKRLYAMDHDNMLDTRPAFAEAKKLGQDRLLDEHAAFVKDIIAKDNLQRNGLPVVDWFVQMNTPPFTDEESGFLTVAQMGAVEDSGAEQVVDWWERNLVMFAHTAQHSEPGDKILIIVGSGHKSLLHQFFKKAKGFELVSPLSYLK